MAQLTLEVVRAELGDCQRCPLAAGRRQIVFGQGNPHARIVMVGEGPGEEEDYTGQAFIGRAGGLLTRLMSKEGLSREDVYITNCVKCRPPRNRDPKEDELAACTPFLAAQVRAIHPRVIVALGRFASQVVPGANPGSAHVIHTLHPAYALRVPAAGARIRGALAEAVRYASRATQEKLW